MYIGIKAKRKRVYSKENVNNILSIIQKQLTLTLSNDEIAFLQKTAMTKQGLLKF